MIRLTLTVLFAVLPVAAAHGQNTALTYKGFVNGFHVLGMTYSYDINVPSYQINAEVKTVGLAALTARAHEIYQSTGRIDGLTLYPEYSRYEDKVQDRSRTISNGRVTAQAGGSQTQRFEIPPEAQGSADIMAALGQMLWNATQTGRCDGLRVFYDGKDLASLTLTTLGNATVQRNNRQRFGGLTLHCRGRAESLNDRVLGISQIDAWLAPHNPTGLFLPIQMTWWIKGREVNFHLQRISQS